MILSKSYLLDKLYLFFKQAACFGPNVKPSDFFLQKYVLKEAYYEVLHVLF